MQLLKQMTSLHRLWAASNLFLIVLLIISAPVKAATVDPPDSKTKQDEKSFFVKALETYDNFKKQYDNFRKQYDKYTKLFSQVQGGQSKEEQNELIKLISSTIGFLSTPDPMDAGERIKRAIAKNRENKAGLLETDPSTEGEYAEREWYRYYTYGQSQSTLGIDGQKLQAQDAEISNAALAASYNDAESAQTDVVTQDILKKMARQNVQVGIMTKSLHSESQKQTRALATTNINLANISERIDGQARQKDFENRASAKKIIEAAAYTNGYWEKR